MSSQYRHNAFAIKGKLKRRKKEKLGEKAAEKLLLYNKDASWHKEKSDEEVNEMELSTSAKKFRENWKAILVQMMKS